ncbi:acyltransferase domain-containing protein [Ruminiclostridium cellulolyticum]|uniref:Acyl transferase n=1 Tax=Ruminiclostridium cellulolyticum (strain ATCC 35319 / DSM 5812 / JCM 6584 / H10) TaxID=394503 RepID=B8I8J2_RUMCH|nr:acyltransferase domain-containing protein [Ruminiclostridium cellulolyticum]ACL75225.1 Acyl transferase [Ruminiclostridium cellulolyticum H10]
MQEKVVFMFPGQGSQYYNMGKQLFEQEPVFRKWMVYLDYICKKNIGESVLDKLYDSNKKIADIFDRTLYTHPAIFMIEYSLAMALTERGIKPDYLLGTSMGEFSSVAVSGVMDIEDVLECVLKQAQLFEAYCKEGGMLAIFNTPDIYENLPLLYKNSELSSVNFASHFVVSGSNENLTAIREYMEAKNIICYVLPVTYGFHSHLIDPAAQVYKEFLKGKRQNKPKIRFVSGMYGEAIEELNYDYLWDIVRKPIKFSKAISNMENSGPYIYIDLGSGGTLDNFAKRNFSKQSRSVSFSIITRFNQELRNTDKLQTYLAENEATATLFKVKK